MTPQKAIEAALANSQLVVDAYLADLADEETLHRPGPGLNHIRWQLGHLIESEHRLISQLFPGCMPELPAGFAERYSRQTASVDDPQQFDGLASLQKQKQTQRDGTLKALRSCPDEQLDESTGIVYAPTIADLFVLQGTHWLMHAGQWAIIRRQLGRPPLF